MAISKAALAMFLARPRLSVHFQPIRRLSTGEVLAFEALARFPGSHGPETWLAAAHRNGRIEALDRLLFRTAIQVFRESALPGLLFVNVEAAHLGLVPEWLEEESPELRPRLVVEVTERDPPPPEGWSRAGRELHRLGLRLSVDDFCPDLPFVRRVYRLRPEYVKLDRGLLLDLEKGGRLLRWLGMLRERGAALVAEGIRNAAQARRLRALGVEYGQGFGLGRPAPAGHWAAIGAGVAGPQQLARESAPRRRAVKGG